MTKATKTGDQELASIGDRVRELVDDKAGFWRSCTGCHETNEGYPTGHFPFSTALKCELGSGCRECGGIGATWDDIDYDDLAEFMVAADRDHENIKRVLIENGIQAYPADQIALLITDLRIPAALTCPEGAVGDIVAERRRQIDAEGYKPDHDDEHDHDLALPRAAACYALAGTGGNGPFWINPGLVPQQVWPYRWEWKPYDRRRNLVRAGALIVAEIERVDRATLTEKEKPAC